MEVVVREFDVGRDTAGAEAVERMCDIGASASGKVALFTDLLGDPVSRIRHSPFYLMLVAETNENGKQQIVGLIRGSVKTVTCGKNTARAGKPATPIRTKVAYVLGLRVAPHQRRKGIGLNLVTHLEQWFRQMGAKYAYMATEKDNVASVGLFTERCGYSKFRTPSILVHPVYAHRLKVSTKVTILKLDPVTAGSLYRWYFSTVEFFPNDVDDVLSNPLCLGTFLAMSNASVAVDDFEFVPESWAVMSVWNSKEVFRLEVKGVSLLKKTFAKVTRVVDRAFPCLGVPSVPNLFEPFGLHFVFGLGGEGVGTAKLVTALFRHAHNIGRKEGCGVVVTEVAGGEPMRVGIPHWKGMSCDEDMWCIKRLEEDYSDGALGDWTKSAPGSSIFVDPREF